MKVPDAGRSQPTRSKQKKLRITKAPLTVLFAREARSYKGHGGWGRIAREFRACRAVVGTAFSPAEPW